MPGRKLPRLSLAQKQAVGIELHFLLKNRMAGTVLSSHHPFDAPVCRLLSSDPVFNVFDSLIKLFI